ncbi:hypothetical protein AWC38_SpisGene21589 [Stylophora pistillata]|uniref:Uncharacterized protein n=1 Tax=Stylophora pistillata TaxID=50429 RepID=A0A2B4RD00_STYPI|nr:hypothetical protein AWC38_SpisGene21589 [Stylophora pistillata]
MVVPQKTENQFYADIVRSLRQNFRSEPQLSVTRGEKKVRIRTNRLYKSALTEDHWRDKYNRHVKQRLRGFYTPAHVPYASVGDVCLDTRDLVMKTVGFDQSSEKVVDAMKGPQGQLQMTEPSSLSPSKMKKMFNKLRSSDEADGQGIGEELIAAFSSEIKSEHEEEVIDQREVHDRYVRNFSSKLRSLYTLLCYVYHLRTKDLRTKVPLSKDFLKTLKTKISTDQKGKPLRHTRNMTLWQLQPHGPQRSSTDTTVSRMDHDHQLSPQMNTRSSFVTDSPSSIFRTGITGSGVTESRTSFMGRKLRRYGGILHVIQNAAAQTSEAKDQLPIWHQVASAEKNAKENGTKGQFPKRRLKKSASKSENSLCDMIREGFDKIQARSAEQVGEKLSKINRKEKDSFIAKLQAVDPYSVFRVDLQRVREADRVIREDYEKEDVKSAPWYRDLENEAQELGVAREAEVIIPLNNLYPFAFDDITTLPFVQAKLCLIVQSLPIYELCSLSTLEALKFLLAKILNCSSGTFNEWMNQRKLLPEDKVT